MLKDLIIWLILIVILVAIIFISIKLYKKNAKENMLKKKILFSIPTIAYCLILIIVFLIMNSNQLTDVEQQVVDKILFLVNEGGVYNPKDLKLLEATVEHSYNDSEREYSVAIERYYVKILGTNKAGGTLNKCYDISEDYNYNWDIDEIDSEEIYETALRYEQLTPKSIKKINNALKEHWGNLGI